MKGERILLIFLLIILLFVIFACRLSQAVLINEFEQNPEGTDINNEWVELYNAASEAINLTGLELMNGDNQKITINATIQANNYLIINFTGQWLDNSDENISLLNGTEVIDATLTASDNSDSTIAWSRCLNGNDTNSDSNWIFVPSTPGTQNNCPSPNQPPTANFTYSPQNPTANQSVTFDASPNYDIDGNITAYKWDFGDATNATGITTQHSFNIAGNFSVNLTVTDSNNSQSSIAKIIGVVQNQSRQNQTNTTQNCMIELISAPTEAYFGSIININISIYRNNTDKYAIYLYIEDNEEEDVTDTVTFHATPNKSANYSFNASLEISKECNTTNKTFMIIVRGLDEKINKSITLKENASLCKPDFEYRITPPSKAKIGENFTTIVKITNNKDYDAKFDVWSYVYRGSKCYSCTGERDENLNRVLVEANSSMEISLYNTVKEAEAGDYSLKVKILREGTETAREYTYSILLESANESESAEPAEESGLENNLNTQIINTTNKSVATGKAIYNSKTELDKKSAEIIFISALAILVLYCIFRPKIIEMRENGV